MKWLADSNLAFLGQTAALRQKFRRRHSYYHAETRDFLLSRIQKGSRVLLVGCQQADLAGELTGTQVHYLELSPAPDAPPVPTGVRLETDVESALRGTAFDYIVLPFTLQYIQNIQLFLETLGRDLPPRTRVVIIQYNFFWSPLIKLAERLGWKAPNLDLNWLSPHDVTNLLDLARFQTVTTGWRCFLPVRIPLVTGWFNRYVGSLPLIARFSQKSFAIARKLPPASKSENPSVSVVVPARNEAGNIAGILSRTPKLGSRCQLIFVEGHSRDNTWEEIQKQVAAHPRRGEFDLKTLQQTGEGKADAVRAGFAVADGDLFMILDADLSVPPEDLGLFYNAVVSGAADFANGSRLIYRMERQAMQILNLFFNKQFASLVSWLIGQPVKDTLCGTKVIRRRDYDRIRDAYPEMARRDPFGDFELLFGAARLSLKICDVPVWYKERTYGSTNIRRFHHGWQLLKMCLKGWPELK